jgi:hypothetical protein
MLCCFIKLNSRLRVKAGLCVCVFNEYIWYTCGCIYHPKIHTHTSHITSLSRTEATRRSWERLSLTQSRHKYQTQTRHKPDTNQTKFLKSQHPSTFPIEKPLHRKLLRMLPEPAAGGALSRKNKWKKKSQCPSTYIPGKSHYMEYFSEFVPCSRSTDAADFV